MDVTKENSLAAGFCTVPAVFLVSVRICFCPHCGKTKRSRWRTTILMNNHKVGLYKTCVYFFRYTTDRWAYEWWQEWQENWISEKMLVCLQFPDCHCLNNCIFDRSLIFWGIIISLPSLDFTKCYIVVLHKFSFFKLIWIHASQSWCIDKYSPSLISSGFLALLDYVSRAYGIAICPSSVAQLSLNLMHRFLSNFGSCFPWKNFQKFKKHPSVWPFFFKKKNFFFVFLRIFFGFGNTGPYGGENFKTLLLQITAESFQTFPEFSS